MFPRAEAEAHFRRLASRHGIEIVWIKWRGDSEASAGTKQVFIAKPTTALTYMIGLHEFGHLVDKVAARIMVAHYPCAEAAAWEWATKHADENLLTWVTPRDWLQIARGWVTSLTDDVRPVW